MGSLPEYFNYFVYTANKNSNHDFKIFTDSISEEKRLGNVTIIPMSLQQFNELASDKLNTTTEISYSFKINDIKPAYGLIFESFLKDYSHWSSCDIDIIWGRIDNFITDELLSKSDFIRTQPYWMTGHCTIVKNNSFNNNLFKVCPTWKEIFSSDYYHQFDESCRRWDGKYYTLEELIKNGEPVSLYDIVINYEKEGKITSACINHIREHPAVINYKYSNSRLFDLKNNGEFLYYHLITVKKIWRYYIPKFRPFDELTINYKGIKPDSYGKLEWFFLRIISCTKGIVKSISNQSIKDILTKLFSKNITRNRY